MEGFAAPDLKMGDLTTTRCGSRSGLSGSFFASSGRRQGTMASGARLYASRKLPLEYRAQYVGHLHPTAGAFGLALNARRRAARSDAGETLRLPGRASRLAKDCRKQAMFGILGWLSLTAGDAMAMRSPFQSCDHDPPAAGLQSTSPSPNFFWGRAPPPRPWQGKIKAWLRRWTNPRASLA